MSNSLKRLRELAGIKINNKYTLNELFDKPYPYRMDARYTKEPHVKYVFEVEDGDTVRVEFVGYLGGFTEVRFTKDGRTRATCEGDQFKIFATVMKIMNEFVRKNLFVDHIKFLATQHRTGRNNRSSLYRKMLQRFAWKNGFDFHEQSDYDGIWFYLTRI